MKYSCSNKINLIPYSKRSKTYYGCLQRIKKRDVETQIEGREQPN